MELLVVAILCFTFGSSFGLWQNSFCAGTTAFIGAYIFIWCMKGE